jgi:hypothetical protein
MKKAASIILAVFAGSVLFATVLSAQSTPGGTVITNRATATYSDGTNSFTAVSNTVTTIVSNVAGISVTPDAGVNPPVVSVQTGVLFQFNVSNTGNVTDNFLFKAAGASLRALTTGAASVTVTRAVIDVNGSSVIDGGDTDIFTNAADVTSAAVAQGAGITVLVELTVNAGANPGDTVQVILGDDANQAVNLSANEVRTVNGSTVNSRREDRGDITATVQDDAQLILTDTVPAGPVALGSNLAYSLSLLNQGGRAASGASFNVDGGPQTGILVANAIPVGTVLLGAPAPSAPAGYAVVYTTSALGTAPSAAVWTSTAPPLAAVTRVGFFGSAASLAASATAGPFTFSVVITTTNATSPIATIADAFARNFVAVGISDQSGDSVANVGDLNGDFTEGAAPGNVDGDGIVQLTLLTQVGSVLLGPAGAPGAIDNTSDDDFTDLSSAAGNGLPPGSVTAAASTLLFTNALQNTGNAADTFRITAPSVPTGFTVSVDPDGAGPLPAVAVSGGGFVNITVPFAGTTSFTTSVTAPAGTAVLTGFTTLLQAESQTSPGALNRTLDNFFAGFVRLVKTATVINRTGVGGPTDPVPGAEIRYDVAYTNVATFTFGVGNGTLTATNLIITEDGGAAPNNWAATTAQVAATATMGTVTDNAPLNTVFTNNVVALPPGISGTFTIRRTIQ